jgi:enhancing lycopene biosynthesis protein 2
MNVKANKTVGIKNKTMINNSKRQSEQIATPLLIPDQYRENDSEENKVIYALSQIGEGSAEDVGIKVSELDASIEPGGFTQMAEPVLRNLCNKGLIKCRMDSDNLDYYFIPGDNK